MQSEEIFISFAASCLPLSAILQIEWSNVADPPQTFKFTPRRSGQSILEVSMMALGDIWWVEQKVSNGIGTTSASWTKRNSRTPQVAWSMSRTRIQWSAALSKWSTLNQTLEGLTDGLYITQELQKVEYTQRLRKSWDPEAMHNQGRYELQHACNGIPR